MCTLLFAVTIGLSVFCFRTIAKKNNNNYYHLF